MITVGTSKLHRLVWFVICSVFYFIIAMLLLDASFNVSIIVLSLGPSYLMLLLLTLFKNQLFYCLSINEHGELVYRAGAKFSGQLMTKSNVNRWFVIVWFKRDIDDKDVRLMIWRDSVNDCDFRRLSRIIRLKRHLI